MERLRTAIEEARKTREQGAQSAAKSPVVLANPDLPGDEPANSTGGAENHAAKPATPESSADIAWRELKSFTPKPKRLKKNRLISGGQGSERGAFDMLRTRLWSQCQKEGWRRIAITSPTMSCGKSTTALNLGLAFSRHSELRTIILETDMRRPSMARMLGIKGQDSLVDVAAGRVEFADQAVKIQPNLAVSMNFGIARNPAEIMLGTKFTEVLDRIEATYKPDVVLFDMPPMLQSDEAIGFVRNVDAALLVALAETTTLEQLDQCEAELAQHTAFAGVTLNRCRYTGASYGYGYGEY